MGSKVGVPAQVRDVMAGAGGGLSASMTGVHQRLGQRPRCIAGAHIELVGHGQAGRETHSGIIPPCLAPGVGIEMNGRVPAASHTYRIAYQVTLFTAGFVAVLIGYTS